VQAMVVVAVGVSGHGGLGGGQIREVLAVQDLGLEDGPERLDLAVGPGRVDLGADVTDRLGRAACWITSSVSREQRNIRGEQSGSD